MILDTGVCTVFRETNVALSGEKPRKGYVYRTASWFRELSFETSPARPAEGRTVTRTDARIRIHQARSVREGDVVVLRHAPDFRDVPEEEPVYRVTRAFHGQDDDSPALITDLTLEVFKP